MSVSNKGVLYPARLPEFNRIAVSEGIADLVRWFWIPEWNLEPGVSSRQMMIAFPALNVVIEADSVALIGPTTRCSERELSGRGWAVGALLRPAAVPFFTDEPGALKNGQLTLSLPDVQSRVAAIMRASDCDSPEGRRSRAAGVLTDWFISRATKLSEEAKLANAMAELIESDPEIVRLDDVALRLEISKRGVQRLAEKYIGLSPTAMIRRRRIQEAAYRVRTEPELSLADIAVDYGYADHAHLTKEFQSILGLKPSDYRRSD